MGHQYFAKKSFPPDCWDPPDGPPYFAKKKHFPLTAETHQLSFFVICQLSRFVRPVGLQIFQDEESFIRLAEKTSYQ